MGSELDIVATVYDPLALMTSIESIMSLCVLYVVLCYCFDKLLVVRGYPKGNLELSVFTEICLGRRREKFLPFPLKIEITCIKNFCTRIV